ncbi:ABC transporter transmembrane domain-containing protein [Marinobacterium jannaschii]|uniref:ABC transporter transmembrane domain-containing protein n=1 Tax=Marinobacterium jannaschii TaxID=64970 RepID=UPI000684716E|nr:ABC transporter transmembrane domain-containing protein [Marinobacterium jannaschii]
MKEYDLDSSLKSTKVRDKHLNTLRFLWPFVTPYRRRLGAALVALVFTALITLAIGQGVKYLIDAGFVAGSTEQLNSAVLTIMGLSLLMALGTFARFYFVSWLGERVCADIRQAVFDHLLTLHPSYFETNLKGEIMSRLTTDTTLLQSIIGSSFSMALRSCLMLVGTLLMMLITNAKLTAIILLGVPLILLPVLFYGRKVRALSRQSQDKVADVGTYAGEIIQHIKTVQSYSREQMESGAFAVEVEQAFAVGRRRVWQRAVLIAAVITMVFSAVAVMVWIGGTDVLKGELSGGELAAFVFYAILMSGAVATLSEVFGELQRAAGAAERLVELLQQQTLISGPASGSDPAEVTTEAARLCFVATGFSYPSRPEHPAISEFSLDIQPGQSVALVGPSGAGKSTLFELLQRFYDPQQGAILLGERDLRSFEPQLLRQQMALVPQQPALFTADVWHNIRYGKPDASDDEVIAAAKAAYADEFINRLPQGYNSFLGDQGVRLSGGQKQRIAIARAILKNPRILLLDEATSALDAESEHQVQQALAALMENRTTLIIAHRLSTILNADRIIVLDQGRMVASGTHEELLKSSPLYQRLAQLQFENGNEQSRKG